MKPMFAIVVGLALSLAGCLTAGKDGLTKQELASIGTVDLVLHVPQSDLYVSRPSEPKPDSSRQRSSNLPIEASLAVGVLDAVAAGLQADRFEKQARSITDALGGFDFRSEMLKATKEKLERVDKFQVKVRPDVVTETYVSGISRVPFDQSTADALLYIGVSYVLSSSGLTFHSSAMLFPKTDALKRFRPKPNDANPVDRGNAIYSKRFKVQVPSSAIGNVRATFIEAANSLAAQMAADLSHGI